MRVFKIPLINISAIFFVALMVINLGGVASAQALSVSQKITITAYVAPTSYVVIDDEDTIVRIDSNTSEDVTPRVFVDRVAADNERELTPEILEVYNELVPPGKNRIGTVYDRTAQSLTVERLVSLNTISSLRLSAF